VDIPIIYSDKYKISLEIVFVNKQYAEFIHADVKEWNKTVYNELKQKWAEFRSIHTDTIYAYPKEDQTAKFAEKFGFLRVGDVMRHRV